MNAINYSGYDASSINISKYRRHKETALRKAAIRFRIAILLAVVFTAIIASIVTYMIVYNSATEMIVADTEIVFVEEGDTLWGIVDDYTPKGMDIRKYIDYVCEYNSISNSNIMPGDVIEIPIMERYNPLDHS